jgi:hypothetical protein
MDRTRWGRRQQGLPLSQCCRQASDTLIIFVNDPADLGRLCWHVICVRCEQHDQNAFAAVPVGTWHPSS